MWWDDEQLAKFEDDLFHPTIRFVLFPDGGNDQKEHLPYLKSKPELSEFERLTSNRLQQVKVRHMKNVKLPTIIEKHPILYYTYDYGEDWTHELAFEGVVENCPNPYLAVTEWGGETPHEEYREASKGV